MTLKIARAALVAVILAGGLIAAVPAIGDPARQAVASIIEPVIRARVAPATAGVPLDQAGLSPAVRDELRAQGAIKVVECSDSVNAASQMLVAAGGDPLTCGG